jgi:hypothetical protein
MHPQRLSTTAFHPARANDEIMADGVANSHATCKRFGECTRIHSPKFHLPKTTMRKSNDRITTTIEREWLAEIIAGTKEIEYRQIKPYWTKRFAKVSMPFELRLLNGMNPPVPEVTVLIHRITKDRRAGEYRLHIKKVLGFKHWDKRRQKPKR